MTTGVLALQGAFGLHRRVLGELGEPTVEVRTVADLLDVERLVIPGGESSVMAMLAERNGMMSVLRDLVADGLPVLGTCAGAILLANEVLDGREGQTSLGVLDIAVRRNAYGRQADSFSAEIQLSVDGSEQLVVGGGDRDSADGARSVSAVFIRAPVIERTGPGVTVLARFDGEPVLVRQGSTLASTFHPELSGDDAVHQLFLGL